MQALNNNQSDLPTEASRIARRVEKALIALEKLNELHGPALDSTGSIAPEYRKN